MHVRTFTGAWIETQSISFIVLHSAFAPSRVRGLKLLLVGLLLYLMLFAPSRVRGLKLLLRISYGSHIAFAPSRVRGLKHQIKT